eukprot:TRINITY_DN26643_c0_g1_i1.p1 TRINITY_DN26643_c0_g1~~TRINITY_DN26643_c0_g1_i1.p1  ORF type:complete len:378 (-),score=116.88 TRINITY_DN26643_c0_g1_i1:243-1376(-)
MVACGTKRSAAVARTAEAETELDMQERAATRPRLEEPSTKSEQATECEAILTLLDHAEGLNDATRIMLCAAAPHAVGKGATERHEFQTVMLGKLADLLAGVQAKRAAATAAAQAAVAEVEAGRSELVKAHDEASAALEACQADRAARDAAAKAAAADVNAVTEEVATVVKQLAERQANRTQREEKLRELERFLTETWDPLRTGAAMNKQWRERNKMIEVALNAVRESRDDRLEESLKGALVIALKAKLEERGEFGAASVDYCHGVLQQRSEAHKKDIEHHEAEAAKDDSAKQAVEEKLAAAKATQSSLLDALVETEDALFKTTQAEAAAAAAVAARAPELSKVTDELDQAQKKEATADDLVSRFSTLRNGPARDAGA